MTLATDIKTLISSTLSDRMKKNPRYSIRALARDLEISPAFLSRILKGTKGISSKRARELALKLGLNAHEQELLLTQVESQFARSKSKRRLALNKLSQICSHFETLDVDAFKSISDWYSLTLLTLLDLHPHTKDLGFFAKRLGIQVFQVRETLDRLLRLEMCEETKEGYKATGLYYVNPTGTPSQSIRSYHAQMCDKAKEALEFQSTAEREFNNFVLPIDPAELDEAKIMIKNFREAFDKRFGGGDPTRKSEVYGLNVQFFRLTNKI